MDGKSEIFECKSVRGVRFLAKMYLKLKKNDIDVMLCYVNGGIWKWKGGKWEEKKKCNDFVINYKYMDLEKLGEWRIRSESLRMRQYLIEF